MCVPWNTFVAATGAFSPWNKASAARGPPPQAAPEGRRQEAPERRDEPERGRRRGPRRAPRAVQEARVDVAREVLAVDLVVVGDLADTLEARALVEGDGRVVVGDDVQIDAPAARLRLRPRE